MNELLVEKSRTALVVIDLQRGVAGMTTEPYPASAVISNAAKLAGEFRKNKMPVFLVRVKFSSDGKTALRPVTDSEVRTNFMKTAGWSEIVPELGPDPSDIVITKQQWGAFYGTELDLQLRRRSIDTIMLCGIATNFGVESTARFAFEYGYQQIFVEDACAARSGEEHDLTMRKVFSRMGRVRKTDEVIAALC